MKLLEFLTADHIKLELAARDKVSAIKEMVDLICADAPALDKENELSSVLKREEAISTAIGDGIAIPHAKCEHVSSATVAFGRAPGGIEFNAPDGRPVDLIFLIISAQRDAGMQLKILALLARLFKDRNFIQSLRDAKDTQEVMGVVAKFDEATRL
jgi:PTS system fructose-specific IIC component